MRTIIVDSDQETLELLGNYYAGRGKCGPPACFTRAQEALQYAAEHPPEALVLETSLADMDGFLLCHKIHELAPGMVPIFVTKDRKRALEAFNVGAAAYILKPPGAHQLDNAFERAKKLCRTPPKTITIRTFGHFDMFVNGQLMRFSRQKSKEILAYLVDRWGGMATTQQILADLWEDRAGEKNAMQSFQTAFKALRNDLAKVGAAHILVSNRNQKAINTSWVDCDYYRLLEGEPAALESFPGQYMMEYSWAETTCATCVHMKYAYEERKRKIQREC